MLIIIICVISVLLILFYPLIPLSVFNFYPVDPVDPVICVLFFQSPMRRIGIRRYNLKTLKLISLIPSHSTLNSTRRFFCLRASVLLSFRGLDSPWPIHLRR